MRKTAEDRKADINSMLDKLSNTYSQDIASRTHRDISFIQLRLTRVKGSVSKIAAEVVAHLPGRVLEGDAVATPCVAILHDVIPINISLRHTLAEQYLHGAVALYVEHVISLLNKNRVFD